MKEYQELLREMEECPKCSFKHRVFLPGDGNLNADVMCVGIAPSKWRTERIAFGMKSRPYFEEFLRILELDRNKTWNTNVVKCIDYGVGTGNPENCVSYLFREIEIIDPKYIILFGKDATKWVLREYHPLDGTKVVKDRIYFTVPHPMTCVYNGIVGQHKFFTAAKKVKEQMQNSLDVYL